MRRALFADLVQEIVEVAHENVATPELGHPGLLEIVDRAREALGSGPQQRCEQTAGERELEPQTARVIDARMAIPQHQEGVGEPRPDRKRSIRDEQRLRLVGPVD